MPVPNHRNSVNNVTSGKRQLRPPDKTTNMTKAAFSLHFKSRIVESISTRLLPKIFYAIFLDIYRYIFKIRILEMAMTILNTSFQKGKKKDWSLRITAGARSKNSATNHSTFQKKSELFSIGGGHVVPVVNNTTCFSKYKWLLFLLLFSSYFPLLSHSFLK